MRSFGIMMASIRFIGLSGWCWIFWASMASAQWRGPVLTDLGPAEGLSGIVNDMAQDSLGFLYLASNTGLYKYDGHTFSFYGFDPLDPKTIGPGEISNLYVTRDGMIWMAMRFGGLNSYNPKTEEFRRYTLPKSGFKSTNSVVGLWEDKNGTLWVGASHLRLYSFNRKSDSFTLYTPDWIDPAITSRRLTILSITPDPWNQDTLWLSVLDLPTLDTTYRSFAQIIFRKSTKTFIRTPYAFVHRYTDENGLMWGQCWGNFLVRFDPRLLRQDTFKHHFYRDEVDLQLLTRDVESHQNKILVASTYALLAFEDSSFHTLMEFPMNRENYSLFSDQDQNLWIGTGHGALVLNPRLQHIRYFSLDQFGISKRIFPGRLAYDPGRDVLYLSQTMTADQPGYFEIPLQQSISDQAGFVKTAYQITGIANHPTYGLIGVSNGRIQQLAPPSAGKKKTQMLFPKDTSVPDVISMQPGPKGWMGMMSSRQFIWFHEQDHSLKKMMLHELPGESYAKSINNGFDGFSFGSNNTVYLFSNEVHRMDLLTGDAWVLHYDSTVNPGHQRIQHVLEDQNGYIWMSHYFHVGKYELIRDSLVLLHSYRLVDGMMNSGAFELHQDEKGRVWAFTGNGLNAIEPATHEIRYFSVTEGLPFAYLDPTQVLTLTGNRIATVCQNGIIVFQADSLWKSGGPGRERVIIKNIRMNGSDFSHSKAISHISHINVVPGSQVIDIEIQALAFPSDYKMEYSYRIVGMFENWISIGRNQFITLPSLQPGSYALQIKAGGIQSEAPVTQLTITVPTPFFRKLWFIGTLLVILLTILYLIQQKRIRNRIEKEAQRAETNKKMAELELKALRSQMNPHFMFNSLNSIKNYILQSKPMVAAEYLSSFSHLIRRILQHSREKSITLDEELETLQLYVELEQIRFDHKFDFSITVDPEIETALITIPPMILQPFVENAIWHGLMHKKDTGSLWISFELKGDMLICVVEDNGIGRQQAKALKSLSAARYKSMGIGITQDRFTIMNRIDNKLHSITIEDKVNETGAPTGTKVTVIIHIQDPNE